MNTSSSKDPRPPIVLPADARTALTKVPAAKASWDKLSYTHRKEHAEAITGAKKPETRARRIQRMVEMLTSDRPSLSNTISTKPTVTKMGIRAGQQIVVLDADTNAMATWKTMPAGCTLSTRADRGCGDVVVLYAATAAQLKKRLGTAIKACAPGGVLWVAYLKQSSGRATTLTRDVGWQPAEAAQLKAVNMIALDDHWAGVKYRPTTS
jgi:hypothetical protein